MDVKIILGREIKKRRLKLDYSQKELGELIGCDRGYISNLENGRINPTVEYLQKIANSLKCTIKDLF